MLSKEQEKLFYKHYMFVENSELCILMNCGTGQLNNYVKNISPLDLHKNCDYFKDEIREDYGLIKEPEFTEWELRELEQAKNGEPSEKVKKSQENINGKTCMVFQSRLNYE